MQKLFAWLVHLFTASGLVAGFLGLLAVAAGDYRAAMFWMLATLVIDGIDGTFARMARVKEVLPHVSGQTIDYVIDFFTYAILPAYLFWEAIEMAEGWRFFCCCCILLSAAIYYGIEGMVDESGTHFVGFPVLWNMVVYVFIFVLGADAGAGLIGGAVVFFTVLHFVPVLFPYPSRGGRWWGATLAAVVLFLAAAVVNVWFYPEPVAWARWVTLGSVGYFALVAAVDTLRA